MADEKDGQGGNTYINMTGGIFIKNIEHVEHLHAVPEKEEKEGEAVEEAGEVKMTKEDEVLLLPMFKGSRENLRQFFKEAQLSEPVQIITNVNSWIANGKISTKFKMKDLWKILNDLNIYKYSYQSWNKQVKK